MADILQLPRGEGIVVERQGEEVIEMAEEGILFTLDDKRLPIQ